MNDPIKRRQRTDIRSLAVGAVAAVLGLFGVFSGRVLVLTTWRDTRPLAVLVRHGDNPFEYWCFVTGWSVFALYCAFDALFQIPELSGRRRLMLIAALFLGLYCLDSLVSS